MGKEKCVMGISNVNSKCTALYCEMYDAMISKNRAVLERILSDEFVLVHITGMQQSKAEFVKAVENGTLNYFSAIHENITLSEKENTAVLQGQSLVKAAVFGGGVHVWRLQQKLQLKLFSDGWKITFAEAEMY